ncbi:CotH kinase family protein [Candidatus Saccharibacteria bacterium]|nr:CotH kinase family protein [Candidatus Saccharibacteria bacterium]
MKKHTHRKPASSVRRTKKPSLLIVLPLILLTAFVIILTIYKTIEFFLINHSSTNIPKLEISLTNNPIEQIDMDPKYIKYPDNSATFTVNGKSTTFDNVEIKGRGNSSWAQSKKSYQLKFADKINPFGDETSKKWLLLANYVDPSYLRDDIAFYLEELFGEPYKPNTYFTELSFDEYYHGLYYMVNKVELSQTSIDLKNPSALLVELDNFYGENCQYSRNKDCFIVKDAINEDSASELLTSFVNTIDELTIAIDLQDYTKISKLIDVDSFARYYLLNEFTVNPDAYSSSFFLYQDNENDLIHAGPGWDFDFALGNRNWDALEIDYEKFHSPYESNILKQYVDSGGKDSNNISLLVYNLMNIPEFEARVKKIYQETLSNHGQELLDYIKNQANYIKKAALKDINRWKFKTNFDEEIDYFVDWVSKRYDHFEETYGPNSPSLITTDFDQDQSQNSIPNPIPESPLPSQE